MFVEVVDEPIVEINAGEAVPIGLPANLVGYRNWDPQNGVVGKINDSSNGDWQLIDGRTRVGLIKLKL